MCDLPGAPTRQFVTDCWHAPAGFTLRGDWYAPSGEDRCSAACSHGGACSRRPHPDGTRHVSATNISGRPEVLCAWPGSYPLTIDHVTGPAHIVHIALHAGGPTTCGAPWQTWQNPGHDGPTIGPEQRAKHGQMVQLCSACQRATFLQSSPSTDGPRPDLRQPFATTLAPLVQAARQIPGPGALDELEYVMAELLAEARRG